MTFASFAVVFIIFVLAGLYIIRPFLVRSEDSGRSSSSLFDSLIAERERLLSSIEELDLELELEKISSQEHSRNRDLLLAEAAEVLRQLDTLKKPGKPKQSSPRDGADDELEKMITARRKELKADRSLTCSNCGKPIKRSDKFCSHCGESL